MCAIIRKRDSNGKKTNNRRAITLIEILLVVLLVTLIGGAVGINVRRAVLDQRFRSEVDFALETMRLAQDLMLIYPMHVSVIFKAAETGSGIDIWMEAQGEVPEKWEKRLKKKRRRFTAIHGVFFEDQLEDKKETAGQHTLLFYSRGSRMSQGTIMLSTHERGDVEGANVRTICLSGHPHPIQATCRETVSETEKILLTENTQSFVERTLEEQAKQNET